jgi:thioredoxin 1
MIHHIENERILSEVLNGDKLVVVDFFATWCGPCQELSPILVELDKQYNGEVQFYKVDVDESQDCAIRYGVNAMPTLVFFKDGKEIEREVGFLPKEELEELIEELK